MFKQLIAFSDSSPSLSIGDKFSLSLTTLLLGMLVVFAVLLIIMLVVLLVGKIFQKAESKKKGTVIPIVQPTEPENEAIEEQADEGELIAAITAAVALCMEEEPGSFRVVSFKKTTAKPAWNKK